MRGTAYIYNIYKDLWTFCDKLKCREERGVDLGVQKKRVGL